MDQQFQNNPNNFNSNSSPNGLAQQPASQNPVQQSAPKPAEPVIPKPPVQAPPRVEPMTPPRPAYNPPVPNFSMPSEPERKRKGPSLLTMIMVILAVAIIIGLAFLFYYYAVKTFSFSSDVIENESVMPVTKNTEAQTQEQEIVTVVPTNIIRFAAPAVLPAVQKTGNCWTSSIAYPYRNDAFRCAVGSSIYDPCFKTSQAGLVFCQMNPLSETSFVIKLTKVLPAVSVPSIVQENWAWFVKLSDGTICSPFTGIKPLLSGGKVAYYGCTSADKNQQIMLIGNLVKGQIWTAQKRISEKQGTAWAEKSTETVEIDTVWQ